MRKYDFDAVVIGTGCAGYNCADWLYDLGVKNIAIVTESVNAGTSRNTGSDKQTYYKMSLAGDAGDSVRAMAETLFSGGAMDGDVAMCEAAGSVKSFLKLANLGVRFPTNEYGEYVGYKTDHDPYCRATSIGPYTSKKMTEVLEGEVKRKGIEVIDRAQAVKVLTDNGAVTGLLCIDRASTDSLDYIAIRAPYIVLATGGPAAIYYDSVYPVSHTGNSSLALDAGAKFSNLSEWQYGLASTKFRWNVSGTYQQVLPRYISVDDNGTEREFLREFFENDREMLKNIFLKGYEWPFDVRKIYGSSYIDLLVYRESVMLGRRVYMDFTREPSGLEEGFESLDETTYNYLKNSDALIDTPIERLRKMNPGAISLYSDHGIDITREPLEIAVCAQHNNGGVRIDSNWQTSVKGLYAAGEVAGSLGIFRPGGSALNSCQVGSMRAAEHIASVADNKVSENYGNILTEAITEVERLVNNTHKNSSSLRAVRERYSKRMSRAFAFLRDVSIMKNALLEIENDLEAFEEENSWEKVTEIGALFKNYDIIKMQKAVAASVLYAAENYGSRGSAYVLCDGDFMQREPIPENADGRGCAVVLDNDKVSAVAVKPLPERNLWFESVWGEYRKKWGEK